ncbi:TATA-box-binding protein [Natronorarus salvus]|uniref:TATA-box-binding protein n=1 Tax=Natronorarus salvus TaxID=3117733 RepID=UPI002F25F755
MTDPVASLNTENVVASTRIDQEVNLETLANDLEGVSYDPDNFPGVVYRTSSPKAAALIFRSGKIVCTGAQSRSEVREVIRITFGELSNLGLTVPDTPEIIVQNVVTSGELGASLNLNAIAIGLGLENVEYEPEQFPGLVYRMDEPSVVTLLFGSGKLVITGGKRPEDAEEAITTVCDELRELGLFGV